MLAENSVSEDTPKSKQMNGIQESAVIVVLS
jgi:hypothetical protein